MQTDLIGEPTNSQEVSSGDREAIEADNLQCDDPQQIAAPLKDSIIKVSSRSRSTAVAGAIAAVMRSERRAIVQGIGAGAVNQAVKALAIAGHYLQDDDIAILMGINFVAIDIDGEERTAVRFTVIEKQ